MVWSWHSLALVAGQEAARLNVALVLILGRGSRLIATPLRLACKAPPVFLDTD